MPPGPDSVTVEILLTLPDGQKCFQEVRVPLPWPCPWIPERQALPHSDSANAGSNNSVQNVVSNALLVFPNPASYDVSVSYDYGNDAYTQKELAVFDAMGRKIQSLTPQDIHGSWNLNTANWSPGMYLVRMEADGNTLQVQRVVISH